MNELYENTKKILGESNINFARMIFLVEETFSDYVFPYGRSIGIEDDIVLNITADIFGINMCLAEMYENGKTMTKKDLKSYYIAKSEDIQDLVEQCTLSAAIQMASCHHPDEEFDELTFGDTKTGELYLQITLEKVLRVLIKWFKMYNEYPVAKIWAFTSLRFTGRPAKSIIKIMKEIQEEENW